MENCLDYIINSIFDATLVHTISSADKLHLLSKLKIRIFGGSTRIFFQPPTPSARDWLSKLKVFTWQSDNSIVKWQLGVWSCEWLECLLEKLKILEPADNPLTWVVKILDSSIAVIMNSGIVSIIWDAYNCIQRGTSIIFQQFSKGGFNLTNCQMVSRIKTVATTNGLLYEIVIKSVSLWQGLHFLFVTSITGCMSGCKLIFLARSHWLML